MINSRFNIESLTSFSYLINTKYFGEDEIKEVALLLAWTFLTTVKGNKELPQLSSILNDELDLKSAYQKIASILEQDKQLHVLGKSYRETQLPDLISKSETKKIIGYYNTFSGEADFYLALANAIDRRREKVWSLPSLLADLMINLGDHTEEEIYIPSSSAWTIAEYQTRHNKKVTVETDEQTLLMSVFSLIHGINFSKVNPIASPCVKNTDGKLKQFPIVYIAQPFNLYIDSPPIDSYDRFQSKTTNGVVLAIEHGLAHCSGKMVALVPQSFLFHKANNYDLRVTLIDKGILDLVIQLPGNIDGDETSTPLALIVIDKNRDKEFPVMFYDAVHQEEVTNDDNLAYKEIITRINIPLVTNDVLHRIENNYSSFVSNKEIISNGYDLSVRRYSLNTAAKKINELPNTKPLSGIAKIIRAQQIKTNTENRGDIFHMIGFKDIEASGLINEPEQHVTLIGTIREKAKLQSVQKNDILISYKGNIGAIGFVDENCSNNWIANQIFMIIRLDQNSAEMSANYLFRYLKSPLVQSYLKGKVIGNKVQSLKGADIKELLIPIPTKEEEEYVVRTNNYILGCYDAMDELKSESDELNQQHWPIF